MTFPPRKANCSVMFSKIETEFTLSLWNMLGILHQLNPHWATLYKQWRYVIAGKNRAFRSWRMWWCFSSSASPRNAYRGSTNLWSIWALPGWLMNRLLTAALTSLGFCWCTLKGRREEKGARYFHPLPVKLACLCLQSWSTILRLLGQKQNCFYIGEQWISEFASQAFVLS